MATHRMIEGTSSTAIAHSENAMSTPASRSGIPAAPPPARGRARGPRPPTPARAPGTPRRRRPSARRRMRLLPAPRGILRLASLARDDNPRSRSAQDDKSRCSRLGFHNRAYQTLGAWKSPLAPPLLRSRLPARRLRRRLRLLICQGFFRTISNPTLTVFTRPRISISRYARRLWRSSFLMRPVWFISGPLRITISSPSSRRSRTRPRGGQAW